MGQIQFTTGGVGIPQLDGVYIDEVTPPGSIQGVPTGIVGVIGEFERGPTTITTVASAKDIADQFGGDGAAGYLGIRGLMNKIFGTLRIRRVVGTSSVAATHTFSDSTPNPTLVITANSVGVWGNSLSITIAAGTLPSTFKVTVSYAQAAPVATITEVFDNLTMTTLPANGSSKYVNFARSGTNNIPANVSSTALSGGLDGTMAASNYTAALADFEVAAQADLNILCFSNPPDGYRSTLNAAMFTHAQNFPYQQCIIAGQSTDTVTTGVTTKQGIGALQNLIYTFNHPYTMITPASGVAVKTLVGPETWMAAVMSRLLPEQSMADPDSVAMLGGIVDLTYDGLTTTDYTTLRSNGICAFAPYDNDLGGFKFYSSVNTYYPTANTNGNDLGMIERNRLAKYIEYSIAKRLKGFNNKQLPLNPDGTLSAEHFQVGGEAATFLSDMKKQGRFTDFSIDLNSGNTPSQLALGVFVMIIKVKRAPNADIIILRSQVGTTVQP